MELKKIFARNVRKARKASGMSQEELGDEAGLTRNYIGMIERCETSASLDAVQAIADALDVSAPTLLEK